MKDEEEAALKFRTKPRVILDHEPMNCNGVCFGRAARTKLLMEQSEKFKSLDIPKDGG